VKWQEPAIITGGEKRIRWTEEAAQLRENPKRWAVVYTKPTPTGAAQMANHVRTGTLRAFRPAGSFEAAARGCEVYVRYIGAETTDG
jgi:hypothetical protein